MSRRDRARVDDVRPAGFVGEKEYGVVTVNGGPGGHCLRPCAQCPWRADLPTGVFPAEAFRLSAPTSYDMAQRTFACHMVPAERAATCAGSILRMFHNFNIRMKMGRGEIDPDQMSDGGFPLYDDYRAMAVANGVDPDDPVLGPCR